MNIKWLEYLMGVVECGSITEASQKLYVSQPAITRAVKSLEKEYRITIFNRTNRGIELTSEGKDFVYYASKVLGSAEILEQNFGAAGKTTELLQLSIASQQFEFVKHILEAVYKQSGDGPLHLAVSEGDRYFVANAVLSRVANIGFMVVSDADGMSMPWKVHQKQLEIRELDSSPVLLAVGPKSPLYDRKTASLSDVRPFAALALDMGGAARNQGNMDNSIDGLNLNRTVFSNSVDTCAYFLMNTDLVMYVSKWTIPFFQTTPVHIIPVTADDEQKTPLTGNHLVMLTRKNYQLNAAERILTEALDQYLKQQKT